MGPEKLEATLILRCNYDLWRGQIGTMKKLPPTKLELLPLLLLLLLLLPTMSLTDSVELQTTLDTDNLVISY